MAADTQPLTAEERAYLRRSMSHPSVLKALRIIDALTAENERLRAESKHNAECADLWSTKYTDARQRVVQVEHEHGADIGHLRAAEARLATAEGELRIIQQSPYSFDLNRIDAFLASAQPAKKDGES